MIYNKISIQFETLDEIDVSSIGLMRKNEINDQQQTKYTYGGWVQLKNEDKTYVTDDVWFNRNHCILELWSIVFNHIIQKNKFQEVK